MKLSPAQKSILAKLGNAAALEALRLNEEQGEGPAMIAREFDITIPQANALINAGRKIKA